VFNSRTWIGPQKWGFYEEIAPGAFSKSIGEHDVRFLINHDPNLVLARNKAGTLTLSEDQVGLKTDADMAATSYGQDLAISMKRGDITQMSFAFEVIREESETLGDGSELYTIREAKLWDVSVVTYPAYDSTDASLRSRAFDVLCHRLNISTSKRSRLIAGLSEDEIDPTVLPILRDASRTLAHLADERAVAGDDETPESIAQGLDAVIDEAVTAVAEGNTDQAASLLEAADLLSDLLLSSLGLPDPADDEDATDPPQPARSTPATATSSKRDQDHAPAETTRGIPVSTLRLRHDLKAKGLRLPA
jgi:hypothetical protein